MRDRHYNDDLRYGIDIVGVTDLVYELDRTTRQDSIASGMEVTAKDLVKPLGERLNPAGTKELVIRPSGNDKIEIIVPAVEQMEVEEIKRMISQAGILEFRIVANSSDHQDIMTLRESKRTIQKLSSACLAKSLTIKDKSSLFGERLS